MRAAVSVKKKSAEDRPECFSPIPFRAITDRRLKRADLAVLGVIAVHDRFNTNGRGCYVARDRLVFLTGLSVGAFSRSVSKLLELGYISAQRGPKDGRRRVFRVIYTKEDGFLFSKKSNPTGNKVPGAKKGSTKKGAQTATYSNEVGDIEKTELSENVSNSSDKIFCETYKYKIGDKKYDFLKNGCCTSPLFDRSIQTQTCEVERNWISGKLSPEDAVECLEVIWARTDSKTERQRLVRIADDIERASEEVNT